MTRATVLKLAPALALATLTSCGADSHASNEMNGGMAVENATLTKFSLTTDAFQNGAAIPTQYTCDGADQTPTLSWGEPPQGTKSFALIIERPGRAERHLPPLGRVRHSGVGAVDRRRTADRNRGHQRFR